jgi:hypothetical protein
MYPRFRKRVRLPVQCPAAPPKSILGFPWNLFVRPNHPLIDCVTRSRRSRFLMLRFSYQIGTPLCDHDRGRVGIAADEARHDGGVDDAEPVNTAHAQVGVDHGVNIGAHPTGASRVVMRT